MMNLLPLAAEPGWEAVNGKCPCPVCGSDSGCRLHADEAFVACENTRSEWPLTTGGWLHRDTSLAALANRRQCSGVYTRYDVSKSRQALAQHARHLHAVRGGR
jgi:hypothetical protein